MGEDNGVALMGTIIGLQQSVVEPACINRRALKFGKISGW
jgi:hypothetical protein